jgi:hypothetical protein
MPVGNRERVFLEMPGSAGGIQRAELYAAIIGGVL